MRGSESAREPFLESLMIDVNSAMQRRESDDNQSHRRELVRTLFAAMDGLVWIYRTHILEIAIASEELMLEEKMAFSEKSISVSEQGRIITQDRFISMLAMVRLTSRLATRINPAFQPEFGTEGWDYLRKALKLRNCVTHPKSTLDLEITSENLSTCSAAFYWLFEHCLVGMETANIAVKRYAGLFREILEKLKAEDPKTLAMYNTITEALRGS